MVKWNSTKVNCGDGFFLPMAFVPSWLWLNQKVDLKALVVLASVYRHRWFHIVHILNTVDFSNVESNNSYPKHCGVLLLLFSIIHLRKWFYDKLSEINHFSSIEKNLSKPLLKQNQYPMIAAMSMIRYLLKQTVYK